MAPPAPQASSAQGAQESSKMTQVRLSKEPRSKAACTTSCAASSNADAGPRRESRTLLSCSQTRSTTSWSSSTSQMPSEAMTRKRSLAASKAWWLTSGSALISGRAAKDPKLRDVAMPATRAAPPETLEGSTVPPSASMRRRSPSLPGLWSSVSRRARSSLSRRIAACRRGLKAPSRSKRTTCKQRDALRNSTTTPRCPLSSALGCSRISTSAPCCQHPPLS
mmetsp:Transcript_47324/g.131848  ORF Transcript_47324/g.131848 Transcript_47324/m.131848 type:complete len:222 (-) Transcript_47324:252-917(-)